MDSFFCFVLVCSVFIFGISVVAMLSEIKDAISQTGQDICSTLRNLQVSVTLEAEAVEDDEGEDWKKA